MQDELIVDGLELGQLFAEAEVIGSKYQAEVVVLGDASLEELFAQADAIGEKYE